MLARLRDGFIFSLIFWASLASFAFAGQTYTYTGNGNDLQQTPSWYLGTSKAFYPGSPSIQDPFGNKVIINYNPSSSGVVNPEVVFGGINETLLVMSNEVSIISGKVEGNVYGGYAKNNQANSNKVNMTGGEISAHVYGGASQLADALNNSVSITNGRIGGNVYGGHSTSGAAQYNQVMLLNNAFVASDVYGGASESGSAHNNYVSITDALVGGDVYGGWSPAADSYGNEVTMSNGVVGNLYGGFTDSGIGYDNSLNISDSVVLGNVYGGRSEHGSSSDNAVYLTKTDVFGDIYGAHSAGASATNEVQVTGGTVTGNIYGGKSDNDTATNNTVDITSAVVTGNIYGGYGTDSTANKVNLNNANITGTVYAGYGISSATDNMMNVSGASGLEAATLAGNNLNSWRNDHNTLTFNNFSGSVGKVQNFSDVRVQAGSKVNILQRSEFFNVVNQGMLTFFDKKAGYNAATIEGVYSGKGALGVDTTFGSNAVATSDWIDFSSVSTSGSIPVRFAPTKGSVGVSHEKPLKFASIATNPQDNQFIPYSAGYGIYAYDITRQGNDYYLNLTNEYAEELAAVYSEAAAARLGQISQNTDRLLRDGIRTASHFAKKAPVGTYIDVQYQKTRFDTSGSIDTEGVSSIIAVAYNNGTPFSVGAFAETFLGDYSTKGSVTTKYQNYLRKSEGDLRSYGGGIFFLYQENNNAVNDISPTPGFYQETTLRAGRSYFEFDDKEMDANSRFTMHTPYIGASVGGGYVASWDNVSAEVYGHTIWTRLFSDSATDELRQKVKLKTADSARVIAGTRISYACSDIFEPYAGLGIDAEALGKPKVSVDGYKADEAKLSGTSGTGELGIRTRLGQGSYFDMKAYGKAGKSTTIGGLLQVGWEF